MPDFAIYASRYLAVYPLTEALDVALHAEGAQVMAHGTLLDAHLFAQLDGHGGGELMGEQLHEGQRADAGALGLLLLVTAQAVVDGRGLHHAIEDIGEGPY